MNIDQLPFPGAVDNTNLSLRDKLALFGDTAIPLIVPFGSKGKPVPGSPWNRYMNDWSKRTLADTLTPEYQHDLFCETPKNIAIRQGGGLTDLAAFDFDTDDPLVWTEFFDSNGMCTQAGTLLTIGRRGFTLWVKMKGPFPAHKAIVWARGTPESEEAVEWRGNGYSIVHGTHPEGMTYQLFVL